MHVCVHVCACARALRCAYAHALAYALESVFGTSCSQQAITHVWLHFCLLVTWQDFDHTCPWTGTAIGRGNMRPFTAFVSSCGALVVYVLFVLFVMLVFYRDD